MSIWGHPAAMERLRGLSGEGQREGGWGLKQDPSQQAAWGCVSCGDFSPNWPRSSSLPTPAPCSQQHRCHLLRSFLPGVGCWPRRRRRQGRGRVPGPVPEAAPTSATVATLLERLQDKEVSWELPTMMQRGSLGEQGETVPGGTSALLVFLSRSPGTGQCPAWSFSRSSHLPGPHPKVPWVPKPRDQAICVPIAASQPQQHIPRLCRARAGSWRRARKRSKASATDPYGGLSPG